MIIGFLRVPGCPRGGGTLEKTLRIPFGKIWEETLGKIRGITTPLKNPINPPLVLNGELEIVS